MKNTNVEGAKAEKRKLFVFGIAAISVILFGSIAIMYNLGALDSLLDDTSVSYEKYLDRIENVEEAQRNNAGQEIARNAGFIIGGGAIVIGSIVFGYILNQMRGLSGRPEVTNLQGV